MRFIHTSDWHLGRVFHGIHLTDDQAYVLDQFISFIRDAKPDAILIAGDIYDRSIPPNEAVQLLDEMLSRILIDYKVPVILIAGNHDSPQRLGFGHRLLYSQGLYIVSQLNDNLKPIAIPDKYGPVYFCPIPYAEPPVVREKLNMAEVHDHDRAMAVLTEYLTSRIPGSIRTVALGHAFVAGGEVSDSERPLSIGGVNTVSANYFRTFNYVALGHLHKAQSAGGEHIRYAGSLMKYSFSEANHKKSVTLVEMDALGKTKHETISLCPRRDMRRLEGFLSDILKDPGKGENREDYIMVTLKDSGAILDAIGKIREIYPNVLHIERPHLTAGSELRGPDRDHRRLGEAELFASFFEQVTGIQISSKQKKVFSETVKTVYQQEG